MCPALLEIGRVAKPHGLRGSVIVDLTTNRSERLEPGTRLSCAPGVLHRAAVADPSLVREVPSEVVVLSSRPHGARYLVEFEGIADLRAAEALRGAVLSAEALDDPDALFIHELIGSELVELTGASHGRVIAVEANPASDLLVLEGGALVPLCFVVRREEGRLVVDAPPGLLG